MQINGTSLSQIAVDSIGKSYKADYEKDSSLLFEDWAASQVEKTDEFLTQLWTGYDALSPETQKQFARQRLDCNSG